MKSINGTKDDKPEKLILLIKVLTECKSSRKGLFVGQNKKQVVILANL